MTEPQRDAIRTMLSVLERESDALRIQDYAVLGALGTEKQAALHRLDAVMPAAPELSEPDRALAETLRSSVAENRELLSQGLVVQRRIMSLLAGAARKAAANNRYGAGGAPNRSATPDAVALLARA